MRSEFEKWLDENNMFMEIERKFKQEHNTYEYCAIRWIWESWQHQQSKVDELQRRNQMLNDNIKEQGQKLVYQNEVIETQAEKLLGLRDENAEMQKRVDAAQKLLEKWKTTGLNGTSDYAVGGAHARQNCEDELEQALKGGLDE